MSTAAERDPIVVVTGDVTIDWNLARTRTAKHPGGTWTAAATSTEAYCQPGGAALAGELIAALAPKTDGDSMRCRLHRVGETLDALTPGDERFHHSYSLWSRVGDGRGGAAWRVQEFLGVDSASRAGGGSIGRWNTVADDPERADVIVLADANLGFRDRPELWPAALLSATDADDEDDLPWIVLKTACPVGEGMLWERLQAVAHRLLVVMAIADLRLSEVQISRGLSWERTAQDLAWELVHNPRVNAFSTCAAVIVSFDTAGSFLLSAGRSGDESRQTTPECELVFDPEVVEGMWSERYPGGMVGYTTCLTAGIVAQVLVRRERPDLECALQRSLAAMRVLHRDGYGGPDRDSNRVNLAFPTDAIATTLTQDPERPFAVAPVEDPAQSLTPAPEPAGPARESGYWTILRDRYSAGLEQLAFDIALRGPELALRDVPLGRFGRLLTVDRHEIESFRAIRSLVAEYARQERPERPLSIAVFGPPGSGKSFGIVQVVTSLMPDRIQKLTFNLSQLDQPGELLDAFHQVRDAALTGKLPLVFWDEFDTKLGNVELGWLRHFLAPMQDGAFQEGQITHPIGPAIFVFAGGTCWTMAEFGSSGSDVFRNAKGPDFVSRLKGFVDILGPNPRPDAAHDPYHVIRRALLLRSMLGRDHPQLFRRDSDGVELLDIDTGVLRALLLTRGYRHGSRSLESIVAMSQLAGAPRFERSALPSESQLGLHVDAEEFLALVRRLELDDELLETLAEANHVLYCAAMLEAGHQWSEPTDDYLLRHDGLKRFAGRAGDRAGHEALVAYERLAESDREQNRDAVRDIPEKLAMAGYAMRPARSDDLPFDFPGPEMERLAEREHDRWMRQKLEDGWQVGDTKDVRGLTHPDLVPWTDLPEAEREKDRQAIRNIPRVLAAAGYSVVQFTRRGERHQ